MAVNLYTISLFTHIVFVISWMFTIPVHMIIDRAVSSVDGIKEKFRILKISSINGKISIISAVVVFLSGAIMTSILNAWAPSPGDFWLVTKQTLWIVLILGAVFFLKPVNDRMEDQIDNDSSEEEVMETYKKLKIRGHIMTTFIVINIFLATTQPF